MFVIRAALYSYPSAINTSELLLPSSVELMTLKGLSAWNSLISLHSFWHVNPQSFWRHSGHHIPRQSHSDRIIHNGEAISYSSCLLQISKGRMWARNLALSPELRADGIARKLSSHGVIFSSSSVFIQLSSILQKKINYETNTKDNNVIIQCKSVEGLFSSDSVSAIKSMILLNVKCLSDPN